MAAKHLYVFKVKAEIAHFGELTFNVVGVDMAGAKKLCTRYIKEEYKVGMEGETPEFTIHGVMRTELEVIIP
jgi:hypothetical protein